MPQGAVKSWDRACLGLHGKHPGMWHPHMLTGQACCAGSSGPGTDGCQQPFSKTWPSPAKALDKTEVCSSDTHRAPPGGCSQSSALSGGCHPLPPFTCQELPEGTQPITVSWHGLWSNLVLVHAHILLALQASLVLQNILITFLENPTHTKTGLRIPCVCIYIDKIRL